jgi:hypothetical protein
MKYDIEEVYGLKRAEYCTETGITMDELTSHLEAEVDVLSVRLNHLRDAYDFGGQYTDEKQRYRAGLMAHIEAKIERKTQKIKDIKNEQNRKRHDR